MTNPEPLTSAQAARPNQNRSSARTRAWRAVLLAAVACSGARHEPAPVSTVLEPPAALAPRSIPTGYFPGVAERRAAPPPIGAANAPVPAPAVAAPSTAAVPAPALAELLADRVLLRAPIRFLAEQQPELGAVAVLDALARTLKEHPELELIELGAHLKPGKRDWHARAESTLRARRVRKELAARGVEKNRLIPQGYGYLCPLTAGSSNVADAAHGNAMNATAASGAAPNPSATSGDAVNERVEVLVLRRDGRATDVPRSCEAASKAYLHLEFPLSPAASQPSSDAPTPAPSP